MALPNLTAITGSGSQITTPAHKLATTALYQLAISGDTGIPTYTASGSIVVASMAASLTDLVGLRGAAGRIVRIKRVKLQANADAFELRSVRLDKHTVANTGGSVATTPTIVPFDSTDPTPLATPIVYTGNPSVDLSATHIERFWLPFTAKASAIPGEYEWNFTVSGEHALVLNGVEQELFLNFGGTTPGAGAQLKWQFIWTEERES